MKIQIHLRIWMNLPSYLRINGLRSLVDKNIFLIGSIAIANEKRFRNEMKRIMIKLTIHNRTATKQRKISAKLLTGPQSNHP